MDDPTSAWGDPAGAVLFLVLGGLLATVPLSLLVLALFRRAVRRAMRESSGRPALGASAEPTPAAGPVPPFVLRRLDGASPAETASVESYGRAIRAPRTVAVRYAVAGLVHAAVAVVLLFVGAGLEFYPVRLLVVGYLLAWPVVPTVMLVGVASRRWKVAGPALYLLGLFLLTYLLLPSASREEILFLLGYFAGIPTVALLLMSNRRLRTAGPFVFLVVVFAGIGAMFSLDAMYWVLGATEFGTVGEVRLIGLIVFAAGAAVGWLALRAVARAYERKRWSDQMLVLSVWWLLFTGWQSLLLGLEAGAWGLLGFAAFVAFALVLGVTFRPFPRRAVSRPPARLLLLRVFGSRSRSERLFRELGLYWRHLGPIQLIGAPDLAAETLDPPELLAFLSGRLRRLFVRTQSDLEQRLRTLDERPDPDGRFRVNELYCSDDTWREAVARLARTSNAILVDLRGFSPARRGVRHELQHLIDTVPARRFVLAVDASSDVPALEAALAEMWAQMAAESPNRRGEAALQVFDVGAQRGRDVRRLLALLCAAVPEPDPAALPAVPV